MEEGGDRGITAITASYWREERGGAGEGDMGLRMGRELEGVAANAQQG